MSAPIETSPAGTATGEKPAPAVLQLLRFLRERPGDKRPIWELSLEAARARSRELWLGYWNETPPMVAAVRDAEIATSAGPIPIRIYDPDSDRTAPIFYFHGGGFVVGDLDTHDGIPRRIALYSGRPVISVGYSLAPEHPYPAPLDDCVAAVVAAAGGQAEISIDARTFALSGDSAGASLALGTAMRLRDDGRAAPAALGLMFGCYDPALASPSVAELGEAGYLISARDIAWYWGQYLGERVAAPPAYAAPLSADLAGLPATHLLVGACDPLRDDSIRLAERLAASDVRQELEVWPGMIHGFAGMSRRLNQADHALAKLSTWLAGELASTLEHREK